MPLQNLDNPRFQLDKRKLEKAIHGMNTFKSLAVTIAITGCGYNMHIWTLGKTLCNPVAIRHARLNHLFKRVVYCSKLLKYR